MTSDTSSAYGSRDARHGSGRRTRSYHASSAATSTRSPLRRRRGVQLAPQVADLVAELGRVLEAQLLGRGEHLLLELAHHRLDLVRRHLDLLVGAAPEALGGDLRVGHQELRDVRD